MRWQFPTYLISIIIAAAISIILVVLLWRRRSRSGATSLAGFLLAVVIWLLGYGLEMASIDPGEKIIWHKIEFIGFALVPTCWFIFALEFTGRKKWLKLRWLAIFFVEPLIIIVMTLTNEFHELIWHLDVVNFDRFPGSHLENGIFYWFHIFYGCFLILVGTILVLNFLTRSWQYFQRQGVILIIGILIPWIGIFLDIFDLNPFEAIYLTPITFTLAGLLITWGILRYQLLDIIPIAREAVIEQMTDGVVVLDIQDRIVDLNKVAQTIFKISLAEAIGKKISEYWPAWSELVSTNLTRSGLEREVHISLDGLAHQYEMRITPLTDLQLNTNGKLVILQDITRTRKDEKALQRRDAILEAISYAAELFLSGKNWEESIQLVLARLGEATDVCRVSIFRNQVDERRTLRSSLCYEWTGVGIASRMDIPEIENVSLQFQGYGRWEEVLSHGEAIVGQVRDFPANERGLIIAHDVLTILVLPIFMGDQWWGFLSFDECAYEREWTIIEIDVLRAAVSNIGAAIQREKLDTILKQRTEVISTLLNVTEIIGSTLDITQVLDRIVLAARNLLPVERVIVFLWDEVSQTLIPSIPQISLDVHAASSVDLANEFAALQVSSAKYRLVRELQTQKLAISVDDAAQSPLLPAALVSNLKIRSYLAVPFVYQQRLVGILYADLTSKLYRFSPEDIDLGMTLARQAALAIERARLYRKSQQDAEELAILYRASTRLLQPAGDITFLAEQITRAIAQEFPETYCSLFVVDQDQNELRLIAHSGPKQLGDLRLSLGGPGLTVAAAQRGEVIYVPDVLSDGRYVACYPEVRSELVFPLHFAEAIGGVLCLESPKTDAYSERAQRIVTAFADDAALALQNIRLFNAANIHARQVAMLNELTQTAIETTDFKEMLTRLVDQVCELIGADDCFITLWDEDSQHVLPGAMTNKSKMDVSTLPIEAGQISLTEIALSANQPLVIDDVQNSPYIRPSDTTQFYSKSILAVPLVTSNRKYGIVAIGYEQTHRFTKKEISISLQVAGQIALAIGRARFLEMAHRRAEEAETLRQAGAIVTATLERGEAIQRILEQLERVVPYDSASVQLLNEEYLEIVGGLGWENLNQVVGMRFPVPGDNPNSVVMENCQPFIIDDTRELYEVFTEGPHKHIRSWLGVPLIVHDRLIGMIAIDSIKPHYFNRDHARLATAFADQVAIVIENARLFQEARRAAERRAILYQASQEIVAASQDEEQIKAAIHDAVSQLMPAEAFMIGLVDDTQNDLDVVYACNNTGRLPKFHISIKDDVINKILTSGKTVFINDIENEPDRSEYEFAYLEDTQSILAVPIRLGDKAIGVITTQSYHKGAYILEDLHLLEMLAAHTAITLENSRLFKELNRLAITDPLTGLFNRRGLEEFGKREVDRTRRFHRPLSAIMLDIDFFKQVNDTYGHSVGDQVLNALVRGCRIHVRDIDIVGRYGGEEIILLLPETNLRGGCLVAGRLRTYVESNPFMTDVGPIHVTISLGVAEYGRDTPDLAALMDKADKVMYMAKQAGRNRVMPELHPEQSNPRGNVGQST